MATNKIHFISFLLFPFLHKMKEGAKEFSPDGFFSPENGALVVMNDSIRAWLGPRVYSHFTANPKTGDVSWMTFPKQDVKAWTKELVLGSDMHNAGKPGVACIDEDTDPDEFWDHNDRSEQNMFFYMHLIQDQAYDMFIRSFIDTTFRYEDSYFFGGIPMTGDDLRGKSGMDRWSKGLLSKLDDQFYVRMAKMYFEATGIKANREWLEETMKPAIHAMYPADLAEATVRFVSISDEANDAITNENFDSVDWPLKNCFVDQWVFYMLGSMYLTMKRYYWWAY